MPIKSKLLIVDDDETVRQCIKLFLRNDFDVYTSSNGYEALELQQKKEIKIIITDIEMPEMSGIELSGKLLENDSGCQIIAISGSHDSLSNAQKSDIHFAGYFEKPFKFSELANRLKQTEAKLLS